MTLAQLAVDGGMPVRTAPLPPWPFFADDEIASAERVLRSGRVNYWTGEEGRAFEREFAEFVGARHAVAVANGTVALELALEALGVGPDDDVVVPPRTFVASASAVVMRGARPVFADVDRDSQNVTAATVAAAMTDRTRAVIAVHLAGWPADIDAIAGVARERGAYVIEDCAQALGATYGGRRVGCRSDAAAFSFCQDKILTTGGEGGMLVTGDDGVWERAWSFKDHGKTPAAMNERGGPSTEFRWLHDAFGTNWRMTELQAAIGRTCLPKVDGWIERRRANAAALASCLREFPAIRVAASPAEAGHAFYKFYAFVEPEHLAEGWTRDRIAEAVSAEGWPCGVGACAEIYREQAFVRSGLAPLEPLPVARELGETSLMFLVHPTLSEGDMADGCSALTKVLGRASRA
ncbi:MAG TPA: DegT/DnrJ/EryC1/StrS aminotransferase family protein [Coriobacteriia bacterium]|jgi:hypothetical protein